MRVKLMRTLYSLAAILLVTTGALIPQRMAYAYNQDVSSGVVPVVFYVNDGAQVVVDMNSKKVVKTLEKFSGEWSGGSGFFVGEEGVNPQYIVTNCHVVADYIGSGEGTS